MLNFEFPHGLKGDSLTQHSTFNTQHSKNHSTFNIQHSTLKKAFNTQHSTLIKNENGKNDIKRISAEGNDNLPS